MTIMVAYGTRPEIIKLAPVILELQKRDINLIILNTGQHLEMVSEVENIFGIKPNYNLGIMQQRQTLNEIVCRVIEKSAPIIIKYNPDWVIIQGDTTTVMAIGMCCFHSGIKVAHVEAGLRSHNLLEPFPEEFNRKVVSILAKIHFAPTELSCQNLINEKIPATNIILSGNTIVDAVNYILKNYNLEEPEKGNSFNVLVTAHRRENHSKGIENICNAILKALNSNILNPIEFFWPVHPNPNVKDTVYRKLGKLKGVHLLPPLPYYDLIKLQKNADLIWTDSGGIQEECAAMKKPVLILRNNTERPEIVDSGFGILVGTDPLDILNKTEEILSNKKQYNLMVGGQNPFGNGDSAIKIVNTLLA